MADKPFFRNGILVVLGNLPRIFSMSSLSFTSFLIPISISNLFLLGMVKLCVSTNLKCIIDANPVNYKQPTLNVAKCYIRRKKLIS